MLDLVARLESCLQSGMCRLTSRKLRLVRSSGDRKGVDYFYPILPSVHNKLTLEDVNKAFENDHPWTAKYVVFGLEPERITMHLVREQMLTEVMPTLVPLDPSYGNNELMSGQVVRVVLDEREDSGCVTGLRVELARKFLLRLLATSGCRSLCSCDHDRVAHDCDHLNSTMEGEEPTVTVILSRRGGARKRCGESSVPVLIGPVVQPTENSQHPKLSHLTVEEYLRIRTAEIKTMCEHKLDSSNLNPADDLKEFVNAAVAFELLQSTISKPVSLVFDSGSAEDSATVGSSCKSGLFVLYNYVRLVSLCDKFDDQVHLKIYPPVPPMNEIDFSLLTDDDEWRLVYDFILQWPSLLKECVESLKTGKPKIHLVLVFLSSLASVFSVYYRRVRILTGPRHHLIPTLHSQICMLRALKEIFRKGLSLLSIQPPNRM